MKDVDRVKSGAKAMSTLSLLALPVALLLTLFSHDADADECFFGQIKEVGNWINPDPNTSGVTRVLFGEECRDASTRTCNGNICATTPGVKLVQTAEVWTKCHPTGCYWGKLDGVYTSENWLRFYKDIGFATFTVWGQIWSGGDNWLKLIIDTDYVDPNETADRWEAWMQRQ